MSLPCINANLKAPDKDCKALVRMIVDYNIVSKLAVYLLYSHKPLKLGKVKLKNKLKTAPSK